MPFGGVNPYYVGQIETFSHVIILSKHHHQVDQMTEGWIISLYKSVYYPLTTFFYSLITPVLYPHYILVTALWHPYYTLITPL
jgi:hypothetical protein